MRSMRNFVFGHFSVRVLGLMGLALANLLPRPALSAEFFLDNRCYVEIRGEIAPGDARHFERFLKAAEPHLRNCKLWAVFLNSDGGSVVDAMAIGRRIRALEVSTYVRPYTVCASACVLLFAAGVNRAALGTIAIHRPYFLNLDRGASTAQIRETREQMNAAVQRYLAEMDISPALFDAMLSVPPQQVRPLSESELTAFRLEGKDPSFDEKQVADLANFYGITSAEYRARDAAASRQCDATFNVAATLENISLNRSCYQALMWGLSSKQYKERSKHAASNCNSLPEESKRQCFRRIMKGG